MIEEEKFIESLYEEVNEKLKEVYKEQKKERDELLKEIAMIILTFTVIDGLMKMNKSNKDKAYKKLSSLIISGHKSIFKNEINNFNNILESTVKKTFDFYSYNADLKDVKKIIDNNFKGKHFSKRVWDNEEAVSKRLHYQVKEFLNGKVNVNQIKKDIEKTFNTSAYNSKRLIETEVNRCQSEAFDRLCIELGVKKVRYNATLDNRLCSDCAQYNDKVYNFFEKIETPRHPLCRCFYTIEDYKYNLTSKIKNDSREYDLNYPIVESNIEWDKYLSVDRKTSDRLNDIHTDLNKYMIENEKEKLSILKISDNTILAEQTGEIDGIELSKDTVKLLKKSDKSDIIFAHNHPSKTTFSKLDIDKIINFKSIKTMTLECSDGSKYILDRGQFTSSLFDRIKFDDSYHNIYWKVSKKYPELKDEVKIYDIWDDFLDDVNKELAKHYGMIYRKVE